MDECGFLDEAELFVVAGEEGALDVVEVAHVDAVLLEKFLYFRLLRVVEGCYE